MACRSYNVMEFHWLHVLSQCNTSRKATNEYHIICNVSCNFHVVLQYFMINGGLVFVLLMRVCTFHEESNKENAKQCKRHEGKVKAWCRKFVFVSTISMHPRKFLHCYACVLLCTAIQHVRITV